MQLPHRITQAISGNALFLKILAWLWLLAIVILSLTPQNSVDIGLDHIDKLFHFLVYGLATGITFMAYPKNKNSHLIFALFSFSLAIELCQLLTITRSFEWLDLCANLAGILLASLVARRFLLPAK